LDKKRRAVAEIAASGEAQYRQGRTTDIGS
jgi:hypothetical protein